MRSDIWKTLCGDGKTTPSVKSNCVLLKSSQFHLQEIKISSEEVIAVDNVLEAQQLTQFPSITLCNNNMLMKSASNSMMESILNMIHDGLFTCTVLVHDASSHCIASKTFYAMQCERNKMSKVFDCIHILS